MPFGQVVIGPPGSGKTSYCYGAEQFFSGLKRKTIIINLDPANENIPYTPAIDINDLITVQDVMDEFQLGPNGGMVYCMEYLEKNIDWLINKLTKFEDSYFIFDFPGQVELYTHNYSVKNILDKLQKLDFRLTAVHLVDAHYCTDPVKYISVLLVSLKTMLLLELPHVNVLSKLDLIQSYGKLAFRLEFYTEVMDLSYLLEQLNEEQMGTKYHKLTEALSSLVEEFGLVHFHPLMVEDKKSMISLMKAIDKANGYVFGGLDEDNTSLLLSNIKVLDNTELISDMEQIYIKEREEL
ncbi:hypothetical protein K502DRAFT_346069 [Neoconidiobolus thromboides FSU 785]|nr:hypothetical protein K502DRAFT_346069 [Neoconidiobolus thromboides FSU 785]